MEEKDVKPGMWVKFIGDNTGFAAGGLPRGAGGFHIGQVAKVRDKHDYVKDHWVFHRHKDWRGDWAFHSSQFELYRDEKGRFVKKVAPVKAKVLPEVIPKANDYDTYRKELKKRVAEAGMGVCSWALLNDDGKVSYQIGQPCHASLSRSVFKNPIRIAYSLDYKINEKEKEAVKPYLNWLANESPIAKAFITKDAEEMFDKGLELSCDIPYSLMYGVCIIIRRYFEYRNSRETFNKLVEMGADWNTVFWLMGFITLSGKDLILNTDGHNYLNGYAVGDDFKKKFRTWYSPKLLNGKSWTQHGRDNDYPGVYRNLCKGDFAFTKYAAKELGDEKKYTKRSDWGEVIYDVSLVQDFINHVKGWK